MEDKNCKQQLIDWLEDSKLDYILEEADSFITCTIGDYKYLLLREKSGIIFDCDFKLIVEEDEEAFVKEREIGYYIFNFGGKYYYSDISKIEEIRLTPFRFLGKVKKLIQDIPFIPLGIHSGFELLNGSTIYKNWIKKAKFLEFQSLGVCERNTLAGVMDFQVNCNKSGIKSIIGEEVSIVEGDNHYVGKLYVCNEIGWRHLLLINSEINVFNVQRKEISQERLLELSEGLVFVFSCETKLSKNLINQYLTKGRFTKIYYQIDSVIWEDEERDKAYLLNLKNYIDNFLITLSPILINDAYYLEKEDWEIKGILNRLGNISHQGISKNQYFKNIDDNFHIFDSLFKEDDSRFTEVFERGIMSTVELDSLCEFKIPTGTLHLPSYIMNKEEEIYVSSEGLFWHLVEEGLQRLVIDKGKDLDIYLTRVEKEYAVIKKGEIVDYFLILWDIIRWCKTENILTGIGRGSAGGCLIAYLMGITYIDPLEYNLLFERFLNEGRVGKSLPDIDVDFQAERKEEVKHYIKTKYGEDYFCSIGAYTTFRLKAAISDLSREYNIPVEEKNYITKIIDDKHDGRYSQGDFITIFQNAIKLKAIKDFTQQNLPLVNKVALILLQQHSASIHPCATVIVPKDKTIYEWLPLRSENGELVCEWEGKYVEEIGLLKEDILGINQLDKFKSILDLIKQSTGEIVDIYNLPMDDKKVYYYFANGWCEDLFHFGSKGLTDYSYKLKPDCIEDLIAIIAVYRPGTMYLGAHNDYVLLKQGLKKEEYDYGCKEITKNTYGLLIYQEQVMQICQYLGGFSLVEADGIRKAMGKMDKDLILTYREKFILHANAEMRCPIEEAEKIWHKMELFAEYCFNRSHAACYAMTGYICQWLKVHYPIQYWTIALQYAREEKINDFLYEISVNEDEISVKPPDINKSELQFHTDYNTNTIYWTIGKISFVGETATSFILKERDENGNFFSFEEFLSRVNKSKVNKRVVENLIYAGCFDEVEDIKSEEERKRILLQLYEINKVKEIPELPEDNYWWVLKQYQVSKFALFNWKQIILESNLKHHIGLYRDIQTMDFEAFKNKRVILGGIILDMVVKSGKKGEYCNLILDNNNKKLSLTIWTEKWLQIKSEVISSKNKIVVFTSKLTFYSNNQSYTFQMEPEDEFQILS